MQIKENDLNLISLEAKHAVIKKEKKKNMGM